MVRLLLVEVCGSYFAFGGYVYCDCAVDGGVVGLLGVSLGFECFWVSSFAAAYKDYFRVQFFYKIIEEVCG